MRTEPGRGVEQMLPRVGYATKEHNWEVVAFNPVVCSSFLCQLSVGQLCAVYVRVPYVVADAWGGGVTQMPLLKASRQND